jgi:hypothetical protein
VLSRLALLEFGFSTANLHYPLWPLRGPDYQVDGMNALIREIKSVSSLRRRIAADFARGGSVDPRTCEVLVGELRRRGHRVRAEAGGFLAIDATQGDPALHARVPHLLTLGPNGTPLAKMEKQGAISTAPLPVATAPRPSHRRAPRPAAAAAS